MKNTNDLIVAHIRCLQDLDRKYKFKLGLYSDAMEYLPTTIVTTLLSKNLSQHNTMFIFSQFVVFYILKNMEPKRQVFGNDHFMGMADNIEKFLIPYNSKGTPKFKFQIDNILNIHPIA